MLLEKSGEITPERWRDRAKVKTMPRCGCDWWWKQCLMTSYEQYCIGNWNVRSMNQGKSEVVKQKMARMTIDTLWISELKWMGMGEFNSDDHYIYYCWQEFLRRNRIAYIVNKIVQNAVLGCNLKNDRMISVHLQGKPFNIMVIQVYAPITNAKEAEKSNRSMKTSKIF